MGSRAQAAPLQSPRHVTATKHGLKTETAPKSTGRPQERAATPCAGTLPKASLLPCCFPKKGLGAQGVLLYFVTETSCHEKGIFQKNMALERQEKKSQHLSAAPILALTLWLGGKCRSCSRKFLKKLPPSRSGMQMRLFRDMGRKKKQNKTKTSAIWWLPTPTSAKMVYSQIRPHLTPPLWLSPEDGSASSLQNHSCQIHKKRGCGIQ